jgi:hypothetical protein
MNTCETIKEIEIPGCYSGVLKVNVGLEPGTALRWSLNIEGYKWNLYDVESIVDQDGSIPIEIGFVLNYFNTYKLTLKQNNEPINIKGYDCYRLIPVKNANEVIDLII